MGAEKQREKGPGREWSDVDANHPAFQQVTCHKQQHEISWKQKASAMGVRVARRHAWHVATVILAENRRGIGKKPLAYRLLLQTGPNGSPPDTGENPKENV